MERLHRQIMRVMLEEVATGSLGEGERLPSEAELADRFSVSRGVVRECFRGLEERGVVTVRQGSGAWVNPAADWNVLDPDVLATMLGRGNAAAALFELLECRKVIEVEAAGLAAARASGEDLQQLSDALGRMVAAAERVHRQRTAEDLFHAADIAFHEAIFRAAKNRALLRIVHPLQQTLIKARRPLARPERRFERALPEHKRILRGIASRDEQAARDAMRGHLETVEQYLRAYAERHPGSTFGDGLQLDGIEARFA